MPILALIDLGTTLQSVTATNMRHIWCHHSEEGAIGNFSSIATLTFWCESPFEISRFHHRFSYFVNIHVFLSRKCFIKKQCTSDQNVKKV